MAAFTIWGNTGNAAYAVPMVKLAPFDPATKQVLGWDPVEGAVDYLPLEVDPVTGDINTVGHITLPLGKVLRVNTTQVVAGRRTGWGVPTGTVNRTTFDNATVTLPQLAARVHALIDDLTAHGLIGA